MNVAEKPLDGAVVWVTRPEHQALSLSAALQSQGAETVIFPTMLIEESRHVDSLDAALNKLSECEIAIFLSANAVEFALKRRSSDFSHVTVLAIGPGTQKALALHGIQVDVLPSLYSSEGLLDLAILQSVTKKTITVFCGENPRKLLVDTLVERGAEVTQAFCYRRCCPAIEASELEQYCRARVDWILSTSLESLRNLCQIFEGTDYVDWLRVKRLVVVNPSMVEFAQSKQFLHTPIMASSATDEALVKALLETRLR